MDRRVLAGGLGVILMAAMCWGVSAGPKLPFFRRPAPPQEASAKQASATIHWLHDLRTAHRFSVATGRPMLVVFGASWCTYCKKLEAEVTANPTLTNYINTAFVPVHLDFERDKRAAEILEVKSLPMTVVLSPDADLLASVEGYVKPTQYGQALQQAVEFHQSLAQERAVASRRAR